MGHGQNFRVIRKMSRSGEREGKFREGKFREGKEVRRVWILALTLKCITGTFNTQEASMYFSML